MSNYNPGYLFYKKYFNDNPNDLVNTSVNTMITEIDKIQNIESVKFNNLDLPTFNDLSFNLNTTYPGLLIGSGYLHDVTKGDSAENAFKIGFNFEYTRGMPVIPGSSIKGVLRSVFPSQYKGNNVDDSFRNTRYELIAAFFNKIDQSISLDQNNKEDRKKIDLFEKEMFAGLDQGKPSTIYNRDIFYDAVPIRINNNFKTNQKRLFGGDYITPHKNRNGHHHLDPFSEPNPIHFLKVMPNVVFEFRIRLKNSSIMPEMTADKKQSLVREILFFTGIGAKTNVGYGQFSSNNINNSNIDSRKITNEIVEPTPPDPDIPPEIIPIEAIKFLKKTNNTPYIATVIDITDRDIIFEFKVDKYTIITHKKKKNYPLLKVDETVKLNIGQDYDGITRLNFNIK